MKLENEEQMQKALSDLNALMTKTEAIRWIENHIETGSLTVQDLKAFIRSGLKSYLGKS